ncbi:hypothetical protein EXT68_21325 [Pectobacterium parmentieri]|uniref:hypothetical protein n=1 Tax=Pectobacterium TaxID=122277 RepID=UPI00202D475C|nr:MULTISPECIES: hypothetical protein [Pectobacterium]MCL6357969.1 hypothetical protein [Pectobacterium parmentieri]MCL6384169.1 hypothetical protein [Pectobacterium parmentieri]MCU1798199.1 hypothetical protein [Pectobacterium polaris]
MDKLSEKLPFDASKLFEALTYQLVVALEYCHKLEKGKRLWVEVYGDVTLEEVAQVEVKLYSDALRDGHQNIWNTLNNWLNNAFDHRAYESLILLTNQEYSPKSTLTNWNNATAAEKLALLNAIYDDAEQRFAASKAMEPSDTLKLQRSVMDLAVRDELLEVLERAVFITGSPSLNDRLHAYEVDQLRVIRESKRQTFIDEILGFIGSTRYINTGWEITCEEFTAKFVELTKRYMKHSSIFPEVDTDTLEQKIDLDEIDDRPFVKKIQEIGGETLVKKAALQLLIAGEVIDQLYSDNLASEFDVKRYQKNHLVRHQSGRQSAMIDCMGETSPIQLQRQSLRFFHNQHAAAVVQLNTFEDTTVDFRNGIYHMLADVKTDDEDKAFYWRLWP